MRVVNESELSERRGLLEELGMNVDPYASVKEKLARLDDEVAKLESRVETL